MGEVQATYEGLSPKGCTRKSAGLTAMTPSQPQSLHAGHARGERVETLNLPSRSRPQVPPPRVYEIPNSLEHLPVLTHSALGAFGAPSFTGTSAHLELPLVVWSP